MNKKNGANLSALGNDYARLMGYKPIADGIWQSLTGRSYTALQIGKTLPSLNFIADGNVLNTMEIRRVNRAFPQQ